MILQNTGHKILVIVFSILIAIPLITPFKLTAGNTDDLAIRVAVAIRSNYRGHYDVTSGEEGHVTIEGQVKILYDKYRIFQIASRVNGVQEITNRIIVDTPTVPEEIIKKNIRRELDYVASIPNSQEILVRVSNDQVILSGTVEFYRGKVMARTVASWQKGVRAVVNNIEVMRPAEAISDEDLTAELNGILDNFFPLEKNVSFGIEDGIVTLEGKTKSLWAKQNIEEEFSNVIGVVKLINHLDVAKPEI